MPYDVQQWPESVYPGEVDDECPEARPELAVLIRALQFQGPSPDGYKAKTLGKKCGGLWQINLKVRQRQIRVLYAPYDMEIIIFRIHKKSSPQEQQRAYKLAMRRKSEYEGVRNANEHKNRTFH